MIAFRHADPRFPFLWESALQPPARWHAEGEGPVHYLADTPDGAWAELIRHEEIRDPEDLVTIRRALWAVELPDDEAPQPDLPEKILLGGLETYPQCQEEARRLRTSRAKGLLCPSAALLPGQARGWIVDGGTRPAAPRDGKVYVLFGRRPDLIGWAATLSGQPPAHLLDRVRHLTD